MPDLELEKTRADKSSADETDSSRFINRVGPTLVHFLFSASKTVQVHDLNNRATQRVVSDLIDALREFHESEGRVEMRISADFIVINDVRVTVDPQNFGPFFYIIQEMKRREVEAIEFLPGIQPDEMGRFLKLFFSDGAEEGGFDVVEPALASDGIEHVRLVQLVERELFLRDVDAKTTHVRRQSNEVFFRAVALMGEILRGIERRRAIQVRKAERLTQQMVDIIQADESILVGLASIKSFDEYTFIHSVNVCILSLVIGDRLRLYKSDLARLGVAALLHDIGKTYIPKKILNKPGRLTDKDWELMKYHTLFGVKELARCRVLREVGDALFVALQHHVHYNMNGYPQKPGGWDLRLFSRIVTVADYYDAMTTPRVYKSDPLTPDMALKFILDKSGEIFDPFVAKVFIQAIGIYPIGTVVQLDNGDRAVVVRQNPSSSLIHRPVVAPVDAEGRYDPGAELVDLSDRTPDGDRYVRSVVKSVFDESVEQKKAEYFTSETDPPAD